MKPTTRIALGIAVVVTAIVAIVAEIPSDADRVCDRVAPSVLATQVDRVSYLRSIAPEARDVGSGIGPLIVIAADDIAAGRELEGAADLQRLQEVCAGV